MISHVHTFKSEGDEYRGAVENWKGGGHKICQRACGWYVCCTYVSRMSICERETFAGCCGLNTGFHKVKLWDVLCCFPLYGADKTEEESFKWLNYSYHTLHKTKPLHTKHYTLLIWGLISAPVLRRYVQLLLYENVTQYKREIQSDCSPITNCLLLFLVDI